MSIALLSQCLTRRANGQDDADRGAFASAYREIASVDSFVWVYRDPDILNVLWRDNVDHCVLTVRHKDGGGLLGIACCHPLASDAEPKVRQWIDSHDIPFPREKVAVISCLAVVASARGQGVSMSLGYDCLRWAQGKGFECFLLQANAAVAGKPDGLRFRIGARTVAKLRDGREDPNHIVLLHGFVRDALSGDECGEH